MIRTTVLLLLMILHASSYPHSAQVSRQTVAPVVKSITPYIKSTIVELFPDLGSPYASDKLYQATDRILNILMTTRNAVDHNGVKKTKTYPFNDEQLSRILPMIVEKLGNLGMNYATQQQDLVFETVKLIKNCKDWVNTDEISEIVGHLLYTSFVSKHYDQLKSLDDDVLSNAGLLPFLAREMRKIGFSGDYIAKFYSHYLNDEIIYQIMKNPTRPNARFYIRLWKNFYNLGDDIEFLRRARASKLKGIVADSSNGHLELPVKLHYENEEYTLVKILGSGTHGSAYQAKRKGTDDDDVVVKIYHQMVPIFSVDAFEREVEILKKTKRYIHADHDNLILIYKMIPGNTFADYLSKKFKEHYSGPGLPASELLDLKNKVREYLSLGSNFMEDFDLVHGDVRPLNSILSPDGMKLIDFGASKEKAHMTQSKTAETKQHEYDYSRLELYYWMSREACKAENANQNDYYTHLLILKASPGRERDIMDFCEEYDKKFNLTGTCIKVDAEYKELKSKVGSMIERGPLQVSREEVVELAKQLSKRFMFLEEGKLRLLLSKMN